MDPLDHRCAMSEMGWDGMEWVGWVFLGGVRYRVPYGDNNDDGVNDDANDEEVCLEEREGGTFTMYNVLLVQFPVHSGSHLTLFLFLTI